MKVVEWTVVGAITIYTTFFVQGCNEKRRPQTGATTYTTDGAVQRAINPSPQARSFTAVGFQLMKEPVRSPGFRGQSDEAGGQPLKIEFTAAEFNPAKGVFFKTIAGPGLGPMSVTLLDVRVIDGDRAGQRLYGRFVAWYDPDGAQDPIVFDPIWVTVARAPRDEHGDDRGGD